ncbi:MULTISPECIES: hypothetical protein [unclassified Campylobacter]|uniref:hypothetical protein n=1 Tax=unclassified Campylobacter TaxID=2593542 RepID=UPI0022E9A2F7|nr:MULTISPECIES: hypothetical protein [unclassified Campylobacter]MDA3054697.1 hypothetical protein [Campylobacter sp. VBCF_07 NA4]MDA3061269.1 hypothetical protein [Campylobacter sp. VBCF_02 NA5]MDA3070647.1 hypothetical protein [Campylobacter sp. VBCF_08 NA3]WBR54153.1 hypothetical protein PF027_07490 [Campylobacter sp. VBCF_01 NA2]
MGNLSDNLNERKEKTREKLVHSAIWVSYTILALHIFVLPHDVLDKVPFLAPYTEFMKYNLPFIRQISLRISNLPQVGILYASNMIILAVLYAIPILKTGYPYSKYSNSWACNSIKNEKFFNILFICIVTFCVASYILYTMNSGEIFDTNLHGAPNSDNINSKIGLFVRLYILFFGLVLIYTIFLRTLFLEFKILIKFLFKG